MKKIALEVSGKSIELFAIRRGGEIWYHLDGQTYSFEPKGERSAQSGSSKKSDPSVVLAPMPGKIMKVLAKEGEQVKSGQGLVILEAMKMEYTLAAEAPGKILTLQLSEGQQVTLGERLVQLEVQPEVSE